MTQDGAACTAQRGARPAAKRESSASAAARSAPPRAVRENPRPLRQIPQPPRENHQRGRQIRQPDAKSPIPCLKSRARHAKLLDPCPEFGCRALCGPPDMLPVQRRNLRSAFMAKAATDHGARRSCQTVQESKPSEAAVGRRQSDRRRLKPALRHRASVRRDSLYNQRRRVSWAGSARRGAYNRLRDRLSLRAEPP